MNKTTNKGKWTDEDYIKLMEMLEDGKGYKNIAWSLNRTESAVTNQIHKIRKHIRNNSSEKEWERFELVFLEYSYSKMSAQAIAERLNRSVGSIIHKSKAINYKKMPNMNTLIDNIDDYYNHECYNMELEVGATYNIERGVESAKYPLLKGKCTCIANNPRHILFQNNKSGVRESILKVDIFHQSGVTVTKVKGDK